MGLCSKPNKASKTKDASQSVKADSAVQPCPLKDANIVSVAWWVNDKEEASGTQWVNLPVEDKWVDGVDVKHKDWLGMKPSLKVKFDKPGAHSFKLTLLKPSGTDEYTATEKARNSHFKYTETIVNGTTDSDGTKVIKNAVELVAGGGYKFKVEAVDSKGKKVKTGILKTKRKFYYVEAKMKNLTSVLSSTAPVDTEYKKHHFEPSKLSALEIPRQENIGNRADSTMLSSNIVAAIDADAEAKEKNKYLLVVAYTDHLAVKNSGVDISKDNINVGPGKADAIIPVIAAGLLSPYTVNTRYLWHDLVGSESWFVSAEFHRNGGGVEVIPEAKVSADGSGDFWNKVKVDVTGMAVGVGRIVVKVNVVDRMRGGLALGGANQTCVCTRAWWRDQPNAKQECTIIHEIGHKLGMVAAGTGISPDKHATHYENKGHAGNHCFNGCSPGLSNYQGTANLTASTCVIFGAVNQKNAYCANCEKVVKKLDINAGF